MWPGLVDNRQLPQFLSLFPTQDQPEKAIHAPLTNPEDAPLPVPQPTTPIRAPGSPTHLVSCLWRLPYHTRPLLLYLAGLFPGQSWTCHLPSQRQAQSQALPLAGGSGRFSPLECWEEHPPFFLWTPCVGRPPPQRACLLGALSSACCLHSSGFTQGAESAPSTLAWR